MSKRDELFQRFGPKLTEAFMILVKTEINILRAIAGLAPRTDEQIYDQITNHLSGLPDYNWMEDE